MLSVYANMWMLTLLALTNNQELPDPNDPTQVISTLTGQPTSIAVQQLVQIGMFSIVTYAIELLLEYGLIHMLATLILQIIQVSTVDPTRTPPPTVSLALRSFARARSPFSSSAPGRRPSSSSGTCSTEAPSTSPPAAGTSCTTTPSCTSIRNIRVRISTTPPSSCCCSSCCRSSGGARTRRRPGPLGSSPCLCSGRRSGSTRARSGSRRRRTTSRLGGCGCATWSTSRPKRRGRCGTKIS